MGYKWLCIKLRQKLNLMQNHLHTQNARAGQHEMVIQRKNKEMKMMSM